MKMTWDYTIREEYLALGLRGFELAIYAIIASYAKGGHGCYYGGLPYLAKMAGCHKDTAFRIVKKLAAAGLIVKEQIVRNNGKYDALTIPVESAKCRQGNRQNVDKGIGKMSTRSEAVPYNSINNESTIVDSTKEYKGKAPAPQRFVKPSVDEVAQFCRERGNAVDAEAFVAFYESNGWKVGRNPMRDWRQAVITWEKRQREERRTQRRAQRQESIVESGIKVLDAINGTNYYEETYGKDYGEDYCKPF